MRELNKKKKERKRKEREEEKPSHWKDYLGRDLEKDNQAIQSNIYYALGKIEDFYKKFV